MVRLIVVPYAPKTNTRVPYWDECKVAGDCSTCGRDVNFGDRCVVSGPTIHCHLCGAKIAGCEDNGAVRADKKKARR